jgi:sodium/potassium-transporting ATPase subunit alpha
LLKYTSKIENLLVSRSQSSVVCFSGLKQDGCLTFLRKTDEGFTLSVLGPLSQLAGRCSKMLHKGASVPYNSQLIEQTAGKDEAYAVMFGLYEADRFSNVSFEVNFEDLPQSDLTLAGFFSIESKSNSTDFAALKTLCQDYQVKVVLHSDLPTDKTLHICRKLGLIEDPVSCEMALDREEAYSLASTVVLDGDYLQSVLATSSISKLKRILTKPRVILTGIRAADHSAVLRVLQDLGYNICALGTRQEDSEDLKRADFSVSFARSSHDTCKFSSDLVLIQEDLSKIVEGKALAEAQDRGQQNIQASICAFYLPIVVGILLATAFDYHLSTMLLFCVETGSVLIPVFSLGFVDTPRIYTFSPLQTWLIVTFGSIYTFVFALADYGYFTGECVYLEACLKKDAFIYAQSAFFISVIVAQWTSSLLLNLDQSFTQITHLHWSSVHLSSVVKLIMALLLCFIPQLNIPINTKPTRLQHFGFPAAIFFVTLFVFELARNKLFKRG